MLVARNPNTCFLGKDFNCPLVVMRVDPIRETHEGLPRSPALPGAVGGSASGAAEVACVSGGPNSSSGEGSAFLVAAAPSLVVGRSSRWRRRRRKRARLDATQPGVCREGSDASGDCGDDADRSRDRGSARDGGGSAGA